MFNSASNSVATELVKNAPYSRATLKDGFLVLKKRSKIIRKTKKVPLGTTVFKKSMTSNGTWIVAAVVTSAQLCHLYYKYYNNPMSMELRGAYAKKAVAVVISGICTTVAPVAGGAYGALLTAWLGV
jgi:hypothetical protein